MPKKKKPVQKTTLWDFFGKFWRERKEVKFIEDLTFHQLKENLKKLYRK